MKDSESFPYNLVMNRFWTQKARRIIYNIITPDIAARTSRFWEENRGKYAGRRGFVIGNGPSLKTADLTRLQGEVTIASNRIYLAFDETPWRPTYLTCADKLVWAKYADDMCRNTETMIIASNLVPFRGVRRKLVFSWNAGPSLRLKHGFSFDQRVGGYSGHTVTFNNLQIAAHLGLNPIYLIGCDHYYGSEQHTTGGNDATGIVATGESHHFHKDYRKPGEVVLSAPILKMNLAYEMARRETEANGFKVFNATRGGYLEAFERADLDKVLGE